ncbi:flavodoxin [Jutongia sp.]
MKKSKAVIGILCGVLAIALVVASVMVQIYGGRQQEAQAQAKAKAKKTLVVYFSATGTTKKAAKKVKKATGGKLRRIKAADPYTEADLDYNQDNCRANKEQQNDNARPEITGSIKNMSKYETIYIGYPIWWGKEPKIIRTFLESYDLKGKKIIPFCTSGGSGISGSMSEIRESAKGATVVNGKDLTDASLKSVKKWTKSAGK